MKKLLLGVICVVGLMMGGCATVGQTNALRPGMTMDEVSTQMGDPSQTQFVGNKMVLKYGLFQAFKGQVPYYFVFNKETNQLEEWYANEEEYHQNQERMLRAWEQAFPTPQAIDLNIRRY